MLPLQWLTLAPYWMRTEIALGSLACEIIPHNNHYYYCKSPFSPSAIYIKSKLAKWRSSAIMTALKIRSKIQIRFTDGPVTAVCVLMPDALKMHPVSFLFLFFKGGWEIAFSFLWSVMHFRPDFTAGLLRGKRVRLSRSYYCAPLSQPNLHINHRRPLTARPTEARGLRD